MQAFQAKGRAITNEEVRSSCRHIMKQKLNI